MISVRKLSNLTASADGQPATEFDHDQAFKIAINIEAIEKLTGVQLQITFAVADARTVCGWSSRSLMPEGSQLVASNHTLEVDLGKMPLFPGSYAVLAALSDRQNLVNYHEFVGHRFLFASIRWWNCVSGSLCLKAT